MATNARSNPNDRDIARIDGTGLSKPTVTIRLDGESVTETIENLANGTYSKPIPRDALAKIRSQAESLIGDIVTAYTTKIGPGEVGEFGSAIADLRLDNFDPPTGLLYGRVQSGKTAAMIVTAALAIDNGFRIIVVLTSNNVELVRQTAGRFRAVSGPRVESSNDRAPVGYMWDQNKQLIRSRMPKRGVVFVCAKEDDHLRALIRFLQEIDASRYPALIMDDEADHATPNTNLARQSRQARRARRARRPPTGPVRSSTTFRLVAWNDEPGELGQSLRQVLSHNVFLQVTATPYGLLLQNADSPLRPDFPAMLHPGDGYTGGEHFFSSVIEDQESQPPLCYVDENEADQLQQAPPIPVGLLRSVAFFLLAAMAHRSATGQVPRDGYKHLSHTSPNTREHKRLSELLTQYLQDLLHDVEDHPDRALARPELQWAHQELLKTATTAPELSYLIQQLRGYLDRFEVLTVNSEGQKLEFREKLTFVVGGNILGRGITIDDLLVTYYLRQARITQMDTMHQHARMYGYRAPLMPYTRVFLPFTLAARFAKIHENDTLLRDLLDTSPNAKPHVVIGLNLRPTRPGILDIESISAYGPRQQIHPIRPVHGPATRMRAITREIDAEMSRLGHTLVGKVTQMKYEPVRIEDLVGLIERIPVQPDESDWDTNVLKECLLRVCDRYSGLGYLGYREMRRKRGELPTGALSGEEVARARSRDAPVLCMLRDNDRPAPGRPNSPWDSEFWYPVVVFPKDMPAVVFNRTGAVD